MTRRDKKLVNERPKEGRKIDAAKYSVPMLVTLPELQLLSNLLGQTRVSGTAEDLEAMLPIHRALRGKIAVAAAALQAQLPKSVPAGGAV